MGGGAGGGKGYRVAQEPKITCVLMTGVNVKVNCGLAEDGKVYLLDDKSKAIPDGYDGYRTVDAQTTAAVKAAIQRALDFDKAQRADFIRPDPASIRQNEE
jgi:hypothetical protein